MTILLGLREAGIWQKKTGICPRDLAENSGFHLGFGRKTGISPRIGRKTGISPSFASPVYFWLLLQSPNRGVNPLRPPLAQSPALGRAWILPSFSPTIFQWGRPCFSPTPQDIPEQLQRFHGPWGLRVLLDSPPGVAFALVGGDVVAFLEPFPADVAGELVEGVGVVFPHVPVQGGFLATGEATDLTPGGEFKKKKKP